MMPRGVAGVGEVFRDLALNLGYRGWLLEVPK